jgi:transposase
LFVLHTGIGWEHLPQELGFGCGMTAWRRLRAWQRAGVWAKPQALLLAELHARDQLEWERAVPDSSHPQAKKGAPRPVRALSTGAGAATSTTCSQTAAVSHSPGRSPAATARRRAASLELLDRVPPARGRVGRSRRRPQTLIADRGYNHDRHRRLLWQRGVKPIIARR